VPCFRCQHHRRAWRRLAAGLRHRDLDCRGRASVDRRDRRVGARGSNSDVADNGGSGLDPDTRAAELDCGGRSAAAKALAPCLKRVIG